MASKVNDLSADNSALASSLSTALKNAGVSEAEANALTVQTITGAKVETAPTTSGDGGLDTSLAAMATAYWLAKVAIVISAMLAGCA
jgi:hypothetical protein